MYRRGEVVTLNIDKSEGAGENSLHIRAGITGMIVNNGAACNEGDYSYVVDFGPEGQWNCRHAELDGLGHTSDDDEGWDIEYQDSAEQINGEEVTIPSPSAQIPEPRLGYGTITMEPCIEHDGFIKKKKVSFEDDLARIAEEIEKGE